MKIEDVLIMLIIWGTSSLASIVTNDSDVMIIPLILTLILMFGGYFDGD